MDKPKIEYKLPDDTAKLYQLAPGAPPVFVGRRYGTVDIRKLTPAKAKQLVDAGCEHIIALPAAAAAPAAPKAAEVAK